MLSVNVKLIALPHPSDAEGVANEGVAGQFIVVGAGSAFMTGAAISCTLIVCDAVDELPHASIAVQVRFTLYAPAHAPGVVTSEEVRETGLLPHPSVAVACANEGTAGQLIVLVAGSPVITGPVISRTFMVCDAVAELPQPSIAVHVLVTLYAPVHAPGVVTFANVRLNALPQRSNAKGVVNDGVAGQLIVVGAGSVGKIGAVMSWTFMV